MSRKKSLYEVLSITSAASTHEIEGAYLHAFDELRARESSMSREDYQFQAALLRFARETLSDPVSRMSYDDKLAVERASGNAGLSASGIPAPAGGSALSTRVDAMSMRADAMSMRADAIALRSDGMPFRTDDGRKGAVVRFLSGMSAPVRTMLLVIGTLAAISFGTKAFYMSALASHQAEARAMADAATKAQDQRVIQEYYQTYGERPASAEEARMLEAQRKREEKDAREAERERRQQEEKVRRFEEDARRVGARVSEDLRRAEERERWEERRLAEKKAEEEYRAKRDEEARLQRERERWDRALRR